MTTPHPDFTYDGRRFYGIDTDNAYEWFVGAVSPRSGETGPVYEVQIGPYTHLNFVVFAESHEGLEHAIEQVGAWLADNAPGNLTGEMEMDELYEEAAQDLYPDKMAELEEAGEGFWHDYLSVTERDKVREAAESDLMYTESGWLTSHEIHFNEVQVGTPLFGDAFNYAMFDYEDGMSDNIHPIAEKIEEDQLSPADVWNILTAKLGVNDEDSLYIWTELVENGDFTEDYHYFDEVEDEDGDILHPTSFAPTINIPGVGDPAQ